MITALYNVLPVRRTATTGGNALRRLVGRTSVLAALILATAWPANGVAADKKKDVPPMRILPATKTPAAMPPGPMDFEPRPAAPGRVPPAHRTPRKAAAPAQATSPKTATAKKGAQKGQLRIMPAHRGATVPNAVKFQQIYHAIPYSRNAYEIDPMYRQELALALLFNRFPPGPMIMPGAGMGGPGMGGPGMGAPGMGPMDGPTTRQYRGRPYEESPNFGIPVPPPGFVPEF